MTAQGFKDATRNEGQIRAWWDRWPTANVGIATGEISKFVVLDIDERHGGFESLEDLEKQYGKLPTGPCIQTGNGEHHRFSWPGFQIKSTSNLRPGVDFRGDAGYVVGVGSVHLSGKTYKWKHERKPSDVALPPLPPWLIKLLIERKSTRILSAPYRDTVQAERIELKFFTGKEIAEEIPADVPWLVPQFLACGAITELDGKVKEGKSTFATFMVSAVLKNKRFLDHPTVKTKVVYLTEQHKTSFRTAMERSGLLGRKDFFTLFWSQTIGIAWGATAEAAIEKCKSVGAKLLVIDTLGQYAVLKGDSENNAGDALAALGPLQRAIAEGIAVLIVRHERKSGGAVGDAGRGSSAFAGAVDILISLRHPEGNHPRNVRLLQGISRFDSIDDQLIALTEDGYRVLGTPGEAVKAQAAADLLSVMPKSKRKAATIEDLVKATGKSRAQVQQLLDALMETAEVARTGKGHKGSPYRYFKA